MSSDGLIGAGLAAGSASLQADALDFFGDAANYAISLMVVGMALRYRASAALAKGATMGLFGLWIAGTVIWHSIHGTLPSAVTMGAVGFMALVANAASFGLLWAHRGGDANMRSAWICTRNDVVGNLAVQTQLLEFGLAQSRKRSKGGLCHGLLDALGRGSVALG